MTDNKSEKDNILSALSRVIANAKSYISNRPYTEYKQSEEDCLALKVFIEKQIYASSEVRFSEINKGYRLLKVPKFLRRFLK